MHAALVGQLVCPVCGEGLDLLDRTLRCPRGHSFDRARQGYVDLSGGRVTHPGDSADMVAARDAVASAGHLDAISAAVTATVTGLLGAAHRPYPGRGLIVEVGAGTGHYLAGALDAGPELIGLAVDVSKPALRRAGRAHPRMAAIRADIWHGVPLATGAADVVLDVFAPRSGAEFARMLKPDGALVVVTAEPGHLAELVGTLGLIGVDPAKRERLAAGLAPWFAPESARSVHADLRLPRADAAALVAMGPSARHVDPALTAARLAALPEPVAATLAVRLSVWRPRCDGAIDPLEPSGSG
jgi:23S rRNA (guanine745-N1)-methyltransferase